MKAIIIDFGGVFNYEDSIQKFWQLNTNYYNIDPNKANEVTLDIWLRARVGELDSELFWSEAAKFAGVSTQDFKKRFLDYTGFRQDLLDFVMEELKGKYKLGMISNQIEAWLEPIRKEKKFDEIFDEIVTSYGVGIAKPDLRIFYIALEELAVDPRDCIYIDDQDKNIKPAKELGMTVIKFRGTEALKKELAKYL